MSIFTRWHREADCDSKEARRDDETMRVRELYDGRAHAGQRSDSDDHQALWLSILVDVDRHAERLVSEI